MICDNLTVRNGTLYFNGASCVQLTEIYGSGLYVMDEDRIRQNCRTYRQAMAEAFGPLALPLYASKAASFKRIYQIVGQEGLGIDVVSAGEIYTALQAGLTLENAYFHSNNKTDWDIGFAMDHDIGYFVVDNVEELDAIEALAGERDRKQKVLLRLTPGIDPHTYEAVATGKVDSKFGTSIETGQAAQITCHALGLPHVDLAGFHCHVGSQVFDSDVFIDSAKIMLDFIARMAREQGYTAGILNLGGGYGVRYVDADPVIDIAFEIRRLAEAMTEMCARLGIPMPAVRLEPGRSIVADAGLTLYTVGTVKCIPGYKNYVSVDGGMSDNPRFALYGSQYTVYLANKMDETADFTCSVVGRCCESGDIIQENVTLPSSVTRGDLVAVLTTGAYNYSMASNYNRIPRLPIVMVRGGESYLAVRRESLEDLVRNDL
mgnify:CR=1 FL=1